MYTQLKISQLLDDPSLQQLLSKLRQGDRALVLTGVTRAARPAVLALLQKLSGQKLLYLGGANADFAELKGSTAFFHQLFSARSEEHVGAFSNLEPGPYSGLSPHAEIMEERAVTLWKLLNHHLDILLAPADVALGRLAGMEEIFQHVPHLTVGCEISQDTLAQYLLKAGYCKDEPVTSVGSFSIRGGIVDLFPPLLENPVRLEFFGDEIESMREFSITSQRSIGPLQNVDLAPMREWLINPDLLQRWSQQALRLNSANETSVYFSNQIARAQNGELFPGCEHLLAIMESRELTLLDYAPGYTIVVDEPGELAQWLERKLNHTYEEFEALRQEDKAVVPPDALFLPFPRFVETLQARTTIYLDELGTATDAFLHLQGGANAFQDESALEDDLTESTIPKFHFPVRPSRKYHGDIKAWIENAKKALEQKANRIFVQSTMGKAERLLDIFKEYDLPCLADFKEKRSAPVEVGLEQNYPTIVVGDLFEGFHFVSSDLSLFGERDLFDEPDFLGRPLKTKLKSASFISDFRELKPGDYVVHINHGIGQFVGIKEIAGDGQAQEFMVLNYFGDDKLYVPLERLDLIQKHSSGENVRLALDKLGGSSWTKTKARIKKSMRDMADELLKLYAQRRLNPGYAFSPAGHWHQEFDEAFEFTETPDQLAAIQDVSHDMESDSSMDRLLCGDVGFGKTEVAMRAAFKAAFDGKQVAILAPTTVLAYQHFLRFKQRFSAFPMHIEMLSRFRTRKEQSQIAAGAASGKIDIIVGTHRLLSKDVQFRDLGLLIIDEEQQFGVAHKERIKQLKKRVDTLTMTATPIPRTLHMSLSGIRDMSVIETPPRDRLSIQTTVVPYSKQIIQAAIEQELERGGQVYFVHNKVENIYSVADTIQKLCPKARLVVGHGQLDEKELESTMLRFVRHEADVLLSTTIIENGLDIPLVNTIIINNADRFGLAQLYQLRGRVGRSSRRAYAYLLIPQERPLSGEARQRLAALKEFSELGSGFKIAALDLELRGAGNLLGGEQHGHINAVGFDLYCQLLEKTIEEMRGGELLPEIQVALNLKTTVKIPPLYIPDETQRLRTYKRISSIKTEAEVSDLRNELEDRYGPLPQEVDNLMEFARLRLLAERLLVKSIEKQKEGILIQFHEKTPVQPARVVEIVGANPALSVTPAGLLKVDGSGWSREELFPALRSLLLELAG